MFRLRLRFVDGRFFRGWNITDSRNIYFVIEFALLDE